LFLTNCVWFKKRFFISEPEKNTKVLEKEGEEGRKRVREGDRLRGREIERNEQRDNEREMEIER